MTDNPPSIAIPTQTRIGHVNLAVCDLEVSLSFYRDILGMRVTKLLNDAAFLSFGNYHHDLCLNTWKSKGGAPRPEGTTGLFHFAIAYNTLEGLQAATRGVRSAGFVIDDVVDHLVSVSVYLRDPDQNGLELSWDRPVNDWWSEDGGLRMGHRRITLAILGGH
jgi:catechol 2,3-dioxygenase